MTSSASCCWRGHTPQRVARSNLNSCRTRLMYVGLSIYSPLPPPRPLQPSFATRPTTNLRYSRHAGSFGEPDFLHCLARPRHLSTTYRQSASFIVFLQRILFFRLSPIPSTLPHSVCLLLRLYLLTVLRGAVECPIFYDDTEA